jgi:hypothetical protein
LALDEVLQDLRQHRSTDAGGLFPDELPRLRPACVVPHLIEKLVTVPRQTERFPPTIHTLGSNEVSLVEQCQVELDVRGHAIFDDHLKRRARKWLRLDSQKDLANEIKVS